QNPSYGWTDNSWGPRAIGDYGAPVSLSKLKKAYEKGTRGISWGPLLTPGPRGQCPSFQMVSPPLLPYDVQSRGGLTIWKLGHCPRA
ncbi:unnamed protein product, partial [Staurois parvus]